MPVPTGATTAVKVPVPTGVAFTAKVPVPTGATTAVKVPVPTGGVREKERGSKMGVLGESMKNKGFEGPAGLGKRKENPSTSNPDTNANPSTRPGGRSGTSISISNSSRTTPSSAFTTPGRPFGSCLPYSVTLRFPPA